MYTLSVLRKNTLVYCFGRIAVGAQQLVVFRKIVSNDVQVQHCALAVIRVFPFQMPVIVDMVYNKTDWVGFSTPYTAAPIPLYDGLFDTRPIGLPPFALFVLILLVPRPEPGPLTRLTLAPALNLRIGPTSVTL